MCAHIADWILGESPYARTPKMSWNKDDSEAIKLSIGPVEHSPPIRVTWPYHQAQMGAV